MAGKRNAEAIIDALRLLRDQGTWVPDAALDMATTMDLSAFPLMSDRAIAMMLIVEGGARKKLAG